MRLKILCFSVNSHRGGLNEIPQEPAKEWLTYKEQLNNEPVNHRVERVDDKILTIEELKERIAEIDNAGTGLAIEA